MVVVVVVVGAAAVVAVAAVIVLVVVVVVVVAVVVVDTLQSRETIDLLPQGSTQLVDEQRQLWLKRPMRKWQSLLQLHLILVVSCATVLFGELDNL